MAYTLWKFHSPSIWSVVLLYGSETWTKATEERLKSIYIIRNVSLVSDGQRHVEYIPVYTHKRRNSQTTWKY